MAEDPGDLITGLQRDERERFHNQPLFSPEQPTIHFTELPEDRSASPLAREWNYYRREIGRLLAEGYEGKWVLIKNEALVGTWATQDEAYQVALQRYFRQPVLIQQVRPREPVLRGGGYSRPCPG